MKKDKKTTKATKKPSPTPIYVVRHVSGAIVYTSHSKADAKSFIDINQALVADALGITQQTVKKSYNYIKLVEVNI